MPQKRIKILNARDIYVTSTSEESQARFAKAKALGYAFDQRGRAYVPFIPSAPRGMRWQHGKLIPRRG